MRFQVPQFIDVEDKIFGPLTFRQFVYVVGGGGIVYICLKLLPLYAAILIGIPVGALAFALAFVKFNGKPFISLIESLFVYLVRDKLYLWKKDLKKKSEKATAEEHQKVPISSIPTMTESKLHDISWGLDVLDSKRGNL